MNAQQHLVFGPFRLDPANEQLWCGAQTIALKPKALAVLGYLVARPGQLVTKEDLLEALWAEVHVGDAVLKTCMREIRQALGDKARTPQYIETVHRRGYRFVASRPRLSHRATSRIYPFVRFDPIWNTTVTRSLSAGATLGMLRRGR